MVLVYRSHLFDVTLSINISSAY